MHRFLAASALSALLLAPLFAAPAAACTCGGWLGWQYAIDHADVVFTGRIITIGPVGEYYYIRVQPYRIWKGEVDDVYRVYVFANGTCDLGLAYGQEWLIFADDYDSGELPDGLATGPCGGNTQLQENRSFLEELGEPIAVPAPATTWSAWKAAYR